MKNSIIKGHFYKRFSKDSYNKNKLIVLTQIFKFKNLWIQFKNRVQFHVHITHSLMLETV
jgi:hypothetical protein